MKVSLKWVREYTEIKLPQEELVKRIKSQIGEVEHITDHTSKYEGIFLAQIKEKSDHPEADKLGVYQVSIGGEELIQVVAGDKDLTIGDLVAYITPGTKVPHNPHPEKYDGIIRAVKLRGVESNGMLASGRELDINNDHESVMVIDTNLQPGTPIVKVLDMDDVVLDIENKALTNRADCFGIIGLAREIAGIQQIKFTSPDWFNSNDHTLQSDEHSDLPLKIDNQAYNLCPRYSAATISNVKVGPSPLWLQSILIRSGSRPINNIVDITNYIMLMTGQPLHAFDYDKLRSKDPNGNKSAFITVRLAKNGEKLNALNDVVYELQDTNLVICDSSNPIALAGMIGGLDTEIDEDTTNIVLESANFDMYNNRKSSMLLGVFTEAVTRYSKGQDPAMTIPAMKQAIKLILSLTGGQLEGEYDIKESKDFGRSRSISLDVNKMNSHLGLSLTNQQIQKILENVELKTDIKDEHMTVTIPSYRNDLRLPVDIHEEVGRLYGYNNIPITLPKRDLTPVKHNQLLDLKWKLRDIIESLNTNEVLSYNFVSKGSITSTDLDLTHAYRLINPLSPELEYMRTSLIPSLLEITAKNLNAFRESVAIYEMNKTHNKTRIDKEGLPLELEEMSFVVSKSSNTKMTYDGSALYSAKAYLNELLKKVNCSKCEFISPDKMNLKGLPSWIKTSLMMYDPNAVALIEVPLDTGNDHLGIVGELSPKVVKAYKLPKHTGAFQLDLQSLERNISTATNYQEPSRYPWVINDICFRLDRDVPYGVIHNLLNRSLKGTRLLFEIEPVDIYMSQELKQEDKKQITLRVSLSDRGKTLESSEVENLLKKATRYIRRETNAVVI